jgi:hypothetical protein
LTRLRDLPLKPPLSPPYAVLTMPDPTLRFVALREITHALPADCWIAARLSNSSDLNDEIALQVQGDLHLKALDLDRPLAESGELRAMLAGTSYKSNTVFLILIEGSLTVETCVTNEDTDGATHLIVHGNMIANDIAVGGQYFYVRGSLTASNLLWGDYNHGNLHVCGVTQARVGIFSDEYAVALLGGEQIVHLIDEVRDVPNLIEFSNEYVHAAFEASALNSAENGDSSLSELVDRDTVIAALRAGQSVTRSSEAIASFIPIPSDVLMNDAMSAENVLACVNSGLLEGEAVGADGWFAQTSFAIGKRRVDEDGDQRDDRVYISVWKALDLYIGVASETMPEKQGFMATIKSVLLNRTEPTHEVMHIQCRSYTEGEPNAWSELSELDETTRAAAIKAWRGTLDYVRKGIGQIRAGYPIAQRVQSEITHARMNALVALPVFTLKYNDWWGDNNGFWHDEIWVGARQKCEREGKAYLRALDLGYENGSEAAGDEENDAIASYRFYEVETPTLGLTIEYQQRQSSGFSSLPRAAADHQLRLLRYFMGIERVLLAAEQAEAIARAERQRIVDLAVLLTAPPYAASTPNAEIFPPALMALSETWQAQGSAHVDSIRSIHAQHEAKPEDTPDDDDDNFVWPVDGRIETWPTALQLARVVSAHANTDLSARFRRLFSFPASAMHDGARDHGQFIGPLFLLDDGLVVTKVGAAYDEHAYWALLDGLSCTPLPKISGLGRSVNRKCFVSCEDGVLVTRDGFEGAEIARFGLPTGFEGLPKILDRKPSTKSARCDELIPFNGGHRVLLRNNTGIYAIDKSGVKRLHPQVFDEDGPYTWPKNIDEGDLDLSMVNMALSPDERFIMVGDQDSEHVLLNVDGSVVRGLDPVASYPHHAMFSFDGTQVLANSCQLYSGYTSITRVEGNEEPRDFNQSWRVYTSIATPEFVIMGNAEGYIHAVDYDGNIVWRHHIGSSLSGVDISPDGKTIIAASYAGYLARLHKGSGESDPYAIGTSPFTETSRWIFWKDEPAPIHW